MKNLANDFLNEFNHCLDDIEEIAVQKDQDYDNERTYWIFSDGSAVWLDSNSDVGTESDYGLHCDNEKLN